MKILITGGAGYIGSMLSDILLDIGHQVTIVDTLMHNQGIFVHKLLNKRNCTFLKQHVMDISKSTYSKFDVIFPLAALVGAPLCEKYPQEAKLVNQDSIKKMIDSISPSQRVIFPNTNSGYGITGQEACDENHPLNSISVYGKTKEEAEKIVINHPNATVFRLATLHGMSIRPRLDLLVNYFTYLAYQESHIAMFEGNFRRNFVHMKDVVEIFVKAIILDNTVGKVYNLGRNEDNMTKYELVEKVKSIFPSLTTSLMDQVDPDKRDYLVDNSKLYNTGLVPRYSVEHSILELKKYFEIIGDCSKIAGMMKNI